MKMRIRREEGGGTGGRIEEESVVTGFWIRWRGFEIRGIDLDVIYL